MGRSVINVRSSVLVVLGLLLALVFVTGDTSSAAAATGLGVTSILLLLVVVGLYFLPTIIAALRHHHNTAMIAVLNFFLGWTFIGWVIFLAMSFGNPSPQQTIIHNVYSGPAPNPASVDALVAAAPTPTPVSTTPPTL
jgi:Superinfection immunity protein